MVARNSSGFKRGALGSEPRQDAAGGEREGCGAKYVCPEVHGGPVERVVKEQQGFLTMAASSAPASRLTGSKLLLATGGSGFWGNDM